VPKTEPPRSKQGSSHPADTFNRAKRIFTRKGVPRRRVRVTTKKSSSVSKPLFVAAGKRMLRASLQNMQATPNVGQQQVQIVENLPSPSQPSVTGQESSRAPGGDQSTDNNLGDAGSMADASPEFRAEMGGLMAYYAARIAAARQGLPANAVTGIVQALMNEQTVAMRSLMERWQTATEKQRTDKPERPKGPGPKSDTNPNAS